MSAPLRRLLLLSGFSLLLATTALAQTTMLQGDVKDQNGQPLKGAVIVLDRTDIKGHYQVKTDKKGHWLYMGLPAGTYDISCAVGGKTMDKVTGVKSGYGDNPPVNFDLRKVAQQQAATAKTNASGELTPEQERGMSKEQREKYEAALQKNSEAIKHNKALDDANNAGQDALKAGAAETDKAKKATDYQAAIDAFTKGSQLDANQVVFWAGLGDAYYGLAQTQTGDDRTKSLDGAADAYKKAVALKPDEAGLYNQLGNVYGAERKIPEATEALNKAAQLDPTMAAKAYYNLGANLVNSGHPDEAADFFKKAIDTDPNYAEANYQYGICLIAKATTDPKTGKVSPPPGTADAFQKYLQLQPNGPYAQSARDMLNELGEKVQTNITNPAVKKKRP